MRSVPCVEGTQKRNVDSSNSEIIRTNQAINPSQMDERKTKLMHLLYIFIVAVGDALHVSGVFAQRQER
jgi:hypothetical protein